MISLSTPERRILIIDDNAEVTKALKSAIEIAGVKVTTFNDSVEAVRSFRADAYDMILLDFNMPALNGFETYRELRKVDEKVKICFLSAFDIYEREFAIVFPQAKVYAFLTKPVDVATILKLIKKIPPQDMPQRSQ
jgi:DNA-binding response OmpR family regulator